VVPGHPRRTRRTPGDDSPTLPHLAITNRHDDTAACALCATAVRIVCANTFRAAELEGAAHLSIYSVVIYSHVRCLPIW
jgi:Domain of unknown function (DUF932)